MNLTLSELRSAVLAAQGHPLAPTNVAAASMEPSGFVVTVDNDDLRAELEDKCSDYEIVAADLKQAEAERDEWERRATALEAHADEMRGRKDLSLLVLDLREEIDRIQEAERELLERLTAFERELTAIRKRKGIEPGVAAYSREIYTLLCYVAQTEGRYKADAERILSKINP